MNELGCVVAIPVTGFGGFGPGGGAPDGVCKGRGVFVGCTKVDEGPGLLGGGSGGTIDDEGKFVDELVVIGSGPVDRDARVVVLSSRGGGAGCTASTGFTLDAIGVGDSCVSCGGKGATLCVVGVCGTIGVCGAAGEGSTFDGPAPGSSSDSS